MRVALAADREQGLEGLACHALRDRRPAAMVEHQADLRFIDQRQQLEQLIVLDLDLEKQAKARQLLQQRRGLEIIAGAMKRHIEGDTDHA